LLVLIFAVALTAGCAPKAAEVKKPPPQKVNVVVPVHEMVTEYEEFTGRTAPLQMIELRSRVTGYLHDIGFVDGAEVSKNQILFEIDKAPFTAEVNRTSAAVDQFKARVDRTSRQFERQVDLLEKKAGTQNEYDVAKADKAEAIASHKAAEAAHDMANLNLGYADIRSPIAGRISRRLVDKGNLVQADITPLAIIVPLDQVYIYFDMDERTVLRLRRLVQEGKLDPKYMTDTTIDVALADNSDNFARRARIDFEDNQIDATTGTLRVRAVAENKDRFLSPGMFVRIRYPIGTANSELLIPEEAVGSDQGRPFVYVVGDDNKVQYRTVDVGPQVGVKRVIRSGVKDGERIVITGLQRIKKNSEVDPQLVEPGAEAVAKNDSASKTPPAEKEPAVPTSTSVQPVNNTEGNPPPRQANSK
jgi:RND family efflux transporter MFP subunit